MDFDTAWNRARKSGDIHDPDLFAASMYVQRQPQWSNKAANDIGWATKARTTPPRYQRPAPPRQAWSELSGVSSRGGLSRPVDPYVSTQVRAQERHDAAQIAFNGFELWCSAHKERW